MDRRSFMQWTGAAAGAALLAREARAEAQSAGETSTLAAPTSSPSLPRSRVVAPGGQVAVVTPNGRTLPWRIVGGVKVGHLVAEAVQHEFAPGLRAECWGYNGGTPGPTIEAVEGDRVRLYVTNRLP